MAQEPESGDQRSKITASIWGMTVGMMGISIPLTAILQESVGGVAVMIPLSVLAAATIGTMAIWNPFGRRADSGSSRQAEKLIKKQAQVIEDLNERVASLEQILNYEEKLLEAKLRKQSGPRTEHSIQTQPVLEETATLPEQTLPPLPSQRAK
jgi:hypothetical protein